MNADILMQDVQNLLEKFSRNLYRAADSKNTDSFFVNIHIYLLTWALGISQTMIKCHYSSQVSVLEWKIHEEFSSQDFARFSTQ